MTERILTREEMEAAVHKGFEESGVVKIFGPCNNEPFYKIRSVSPTTHEVHIGRSTFTTAQIGELLKACGRITVMGDPDILYERLLDKAEALNEAGMNVDGLLPQLWRMVFEEEIAKIPALEDEGTPFPGQFTNGNLITLSIRLEGFVKEGIGFAFEKVRLIAEVDGQQIEVFQRCPIHKFVKNRWFPAYVAVRARIATENPFLIPVEEQEIV